MIEGGIGGANTRTGLIFEDFVDLGACLSKTEGYSIKDTWVFFNGDAVARIFKKHALYDFLKNNNVDWRRHISRMLLPDNCIYVIMNNTVFIIEVKFQHVNGSVDEKLQTCDFKKKEYQKLFSELNYKVEYWYVLNDWFKDPQYKDMLDYVLSVNCRYFFNYIPLSELGLPLPEGYVSDDLNASYNR